VNCEIYNSFVQKKKTEEFFNFSLCKLSNLQLTSFRFQRTLEVKKSKNRTGVLLLGGVYYSLLSFFFNNNLNFDFFSLDFFGMILLSLVLVLDLFIWFLAVAPQNLNNLKYTSNIINMKIYIKL
jgi:hypothetical protein